MHWSPDGGARWSAVNTGLTVTHDTPGVHPGDPPIPHPALVPTIHTLAVADVAGHQAPQVLYTGTDPGWQFDTRKPEDGGIRGRRLNGAAVFSSDDFRHTWAMVGHDNAGLAGADVHALAIAPVADRQAPATVYAGTGGGVFKTTDGGTTWAATDTVGLTSPDLRALAIDPSTPATVYAGTSGGVFKTTDGGTTWAATDRIGLTPKDRPAGLDVRALAIDPPTPQTPTVVYAGTSGGVFKTTDGGATWQDTAATYYGGAYKTTSGLADNVFLGSYSESGEGSGSEFVWPTLVLGGKFGGGFGPSTDGSLITNVLGSNGVVGLPLRSPVMHKIRTFKRDPIGGGVFGAYDPDDDVILGDAGAGAIVVGLPPVLPPAPDITGHQLTIKKIDSTTNPVLIEATNAAPIDGIMQDITLNNDPANHITLIGVTLVAAHDGWQIVGKLSPEKSGGI